GAEIYHERGHAPRTRANLRPLYRRRVPRGRTSPFILPGCGIELPDCSAPSTDGGKLGVMLQGERIDRRTGKWRFGSVGALVLGALTYACGSSKSEGKGTDDPNGSGSGGHDGSTSSGGGSSEPIGGEPVGNLPAASCEAEGGSDEVSEPTLIA